MILYSEMCQQLKDLDKLLNPFTFQMTSMYSVQVIAWINVLQKYKRHQVDFKVTEPEEFIDMSFISGSATNL